MVLCHAPHILKETSPHYPRQAFRPSTLMSRSSRMIAPSLKQSAFTFLLGLVGLVTISACTSEQPPESYVARVGDHHLEQEQLDRRLQGLTPTLDSSQARQQVIDQWVTRTLLLQEAQRLNLENDPDVRRQLENQRRSTLVTAMTNRLHEATDVSPTEDEIRTYFEQHREQFRLREPYVRIRYLSTVQIDSARTVRTLLQSMPPAVRDTAWTRLARRFAVDPDRADTLSKKFMPVGRLPSLLPFSADQVASLQANDLGPIVEARERYHLIELVERVPEGSAPKLAWVRDDIQQRLKIENRKQMYAREVQRLRNRARADNLLETPDRP